MHELSIAISLVEAAEEELEKLGNVEVLAIHLELGRLAGVVRDSLEFSYEIACQNTPLAGTRLLIEELRVRNRFAAGLSLRRLRHHRRYSRPRPRAQSGRA
jgi:hydrogenase nickel incorporation protein HypA/HybF